MIYENSKLKEVIDTFDGLAKRDINIYYPCVKKTLSEVLNLDEFTKYKNDLVSYLLNILPVVFSKKLGEEFSESFYYKFSSENGSVKYVQSKIDENDRSFQLTEETLFSFILNKSLLALIEEDDRVPKEVVALAAVYQLIEEIKGDFSSEDHKDDKDYDIGDIQEKSDNKVEEELGKHTPLIYTCIKYIYSREDLTQWRSNFFEDLNRGVYTKFAESILSAEFFELDDYTQRINTILAKHKSLNADDWESYIVPYTYYSLRNIFIHIIERCNIIRDMFICDNQNKEWISIDSSPKHVILAKTYMGYNETVYYDTLLRNICDLTDIDLTYVTSTDNIRTLVRVIRHSLIYITAHESGMRKLDADFLGILNSVKVKAAVLLNGMIEQPMYDKSLEINYIIGDKEIIKVVNKTYKLAISQPDKIHKNKYLSFWRDHKSHTFSIDQLQDPLKRDIDDLTPDSGSTRTTETEADNSGKHNDIQLYNKFVKHSIGVDAKISSVIEDINTHHSGNIDINSFISVSQNIENLVNYRDTTSSFLYRAIIFIFDNKDRWEDAMAQSDKNYSLLASRLLGRLRVYLDAYSSGNKPRLSFRPTFQCSFYTIIDGVIVYSQHMTEGSIFFASICFSPLNSYYLERFYTKYTTILTTHNQEYFSDISKQIKTNVTTHLQEKLVEERKGTIQILGIFAALLAFVSMSIGMFKMAETPWEFALYCCAFTSALLLFVLAVKFIASSEKDQLKWGRDENKILKIIIPIIIMGIILAVSIPFRGRKHESENMIQTNTTIMNQHSLEIIQENNPVDSTGMKVEPQAPNP